VGNEFPISTTSRSQHAEQPSPVPPAAQTAQVYWLKDTGNHLDLVKKPVTVATNQSNGVLEAAFMLLAGPTDASVSSTIPQSTKLRT